MLFLVALCEYLREKGEDPALQRHAIASLASLSPQHFQKVLPMLLEATGKLRRTTKSKEYNISKLLETIRSCRFAYQKINAVYQLSKCNWDNVGVKSTIIGVADFQETRSQWDERVAGAIALRKMPQRDAITLRKLINIFKGEFHPKVRMELITTFGELKWNEQPVIDLLKVVFDNEEEDSSMRRRAALSLGKITKLDENLRRKAITFLCHNVLKLNAEEKKYTAEAIGYLGTTEDPQVGITILQLLEDENEEVKKEAGKALSALNC